MRGFYYILKECFLLCFVTGFLPKIKCMRRSSEGVVHKAFTSIFKIMNIKLKKGLFLQKIGYKKIDTETTGGL